MAYLGPPPSQKLATPTSQYFSGNGSTTAFTLNRPVNVAEDLNVFVNNVPQEPGSGKSYTATGTTLTFDAAPSSGTNNVYVVYRGLAEPTTRLEHPSGQPLAATTGTFSGDLTVDTTTLKVDSTNNLVGIGTATPASYDGEADNLVIASSGHTGVTIASTGSDQRTNLYFSDGTSGTAPYVGGFSYNHSDNSLLVRTSGAERLRIDSTGRVTMPGQPVFRVYNAPPTSTNAVLIWATKALDVGGNYSTSTGRFTAPVAGNYLFTLSHLSLSSGSNYTRLLFAVNGSSLTTYADTLESGNGSYISVNASTIIALSANDYVTVYSTGQLTTYNGPYGSFCGHLIS
jgi:hypothetical protein|tara:strand:+ start:237 stop:1265 length:1029 start_codon:yes stop_codon:yes gene_type:complete